jgi:hypothetical protein
MHAVARDERTAQQDELWIDMESVDLISICSVSSPACETVDARLT